MSTQASIRSMETGSVYPITLGRFTIGRGKGNDLVIDHPTLSRQHAVIVYQHGDYLLRDLESTNGTFVSGRLITGEFILGNGDVIAFGNAPKMVFVLEDHAQYR